MVTDDAHVTYQSVTYNDEEKNCIAGYYARNQSSTSDWIGWAGACSEGNNVTFLYANNHDPYVVQSNSWNYVFQQQYNGAKNADGDIYINRWTGGDLGIQIDLPYCADCANSNRKMWLFGDSIISGIDSSNQRTYADGANRFGNFFAITSHGSTNTRQAVDNPLFDWGAKTSVQSEINPFNYSWMPLLMDTSSASDLSDLHPLRIAARGYDGSGFTRTQNSIASVYRSPWTGQALHYNTTTSSETRNSDLIPVYEYYNKNTNASYYTTVQKKSDDLKISGNDYFVYQRVAFWIMKSSGSNRNALYRYYTSNLSDMILSTSEQKPADYDMDENPDKTQAPIGYVYAGGVDNTDDGNGYLLYNLWEYSKSGVSHVYTTRQHDSYGDKLAMWPLHGVVIGNDLVVMLSPVHLYGWDWEYVEKSVVAIVKNVNQPYLNWGKALKDNWTTSTPEQYSLETSNASITWRFIMKAPDYDTTKYVYVYGQRDNHDILPDGTPNPYYHHFTDLILARVHFPTPTAEDFKNIDNWSYYSSGSWVNDSKYATNIACRETNANGECIRDSGCAGVVKSPSNNNEYILVGSIYNEVDGIFKFYKSVNGPTGPFTLWNDTVDITTFDLERDYALSDACVTTGEDGKNYYDIYKCKYYGVGIGVHPGLSVAGDTDGLMLSYTRMGNNNGNYFYAGTDPGLYTLRFINLSWNDILNPVNKVDIPISASADDIHVYSVDSNGSVWVADSTFTQTGAGDLSGFGLWRNGSGMRFPNVTIPYNATITKAYLTFTSSADTVMAEVKSRIIGEKALNAATFSNVANYRGRQRTGAQVTWDIQQDWTAETAYTTPDIKSIIKEIISQPGWSSGNAVVLFWDDHDGRSAENKSKIVWSCDGVCSSDETKYKTPKLHIEYRLPN
jgi:hypothetical protein